MLSLSKRRLRQQARAGLGVLSMYDPVHLGIDEGGRPVEVVLAYHNMLLRGEPGSGKSSSINNVVAHAALSVDSPAGAD